MKKVNKNVKYCPECGTPNEIKSKYCIKCGHDFYEHKKKRLKLSQILLIIIILLILWIITRLVLNKPIIPELLQGVFGKNNLSNLTIFQNLTKNNSLNVKFMNFSR